MKITSDLTKPNNSNFDFDSTDFFLNRLYDRGTRGYFRGCECNKGTFYTYVLQHFIYDREIIGFKINLYKITKN
jgi:hypothetical protein